MMTNNDFEEGYYYELEQMLWKMINMSGVKVTNLQRSPKPHLGYSGILFYGNEEGYRFVVDLDEEELNFVFQVFFPLKTDDKSIDSVFMMSILADMIIDKEGSILPTIDNEVVLFRYISLYEPICEEYAMNSIRILGSIVYAFTPYFRAISNGEYPFKNYEGGSAIGRAVPRLLLPETDDVLVSESWSDSCDYCEEKWYQRFRDDNNFKRICRRIADRLAEQKRRQEHFDYIKHSNNLEPIFIIEYQSDYLEEVRKLLTELQTYIVSIDKDHLDCLHPDYREKMALVDLADVEYNNGKCYLAIKNQTVVGVIMGKISEYNPFDYLDYRCPKSGEITELVVTKSERNSGIGNILISSMESYFRHMRCEYVKVEVLAYNTNAIHFYQKHHYHNRMYIAIKELQ